MPKKTEQVMVRLTPERKERWEQMAEQEGMSVPERIRKAMENADGGASNTIENVEGLDEITETVDTVDERTEDIQSQLSTVSTAINDMKQLVDGEVSSVEEQKVLEHIPEKSDCVEKVQGHDGIEEDFMPENTASPPSVANKINPQNPPIEAVRRTLEQIALRSATVKSITYNGGQSVGYYVDV